MNDATRALGLFLRFSCVLALALSGCASAVDDGSPTSAEQSVTATSEALKGDATTKADVADATADAVDPKATGCAAADAASDDKAYAEFYTTIEKAAVGLDTTTGYGSSCRAACRCCRWGNRFCCSHCRFCSGPIGVSGEVLSP